MPTLRVEITGTLSEIRLAVQHAFYDLTRGVTSGEGWRLYPQDPLRPQEPDNRVIPAEVESDDQAVRGEFDALPWFEQASPEELVSLAAAEFRWGYEADEVAQFCEDMHPDVARVFEYLQNQPKSHRDPVGYACLIEVQPALFWLKENRPAVFQEILKDCGYEEADAYPPESKTNEDPARHLEAL